MADVTVEQVPPGSLIILKGVQIEPPELVDELAAVLRDHLGHDQLALLVFDEASGKVVVVSDPEYFPTWLGDALEDARERRLNAHVAKPPARPSFRVSGQQLKR